MFGYAVLGVASQEEARAEALRELAAQRKAEEDGKALEEESAKQALERQEEEARAKKLEAEKVKKSAAKHDSTRAGPVAAAPVSKASRTNLAAGSGAPSSAAGTPTSEASVASRVSAAPTATVALQQPRPPSGSVAGGGSTVAVPPAPHVADDSDDDFSSDSDDIGDAVEPVTAHFKPSPFLADIMKHVEAQATSWPWMFPDGAPNPEDAKALTDADGV